MIHCYKAELRFSSVNQPQAVIYYQFSYSDADPSSLNFLINLKQISLPTVKLYNSLPLHPTATIHSIFLALCSPFHKLLRVPGGLYLQSETGTSREFTVSQHPAVFTGMTVISLPMWHGFFAFLYFLLPPGTVFIVAQHLQYIKEPLMSC